MTYIKKCPFLILLLWSSAIAAALHYGAFERTVTTIKNVTGIESVKDSLENETAMSSETGNTQTDVPEEIAGSETGAIGGTEVSGTENESGNENASAEELPKELHYTLAQVDDAYFEDAVFIGDSRTVGLSQYGNMPQTTFYAATGFTIFKFFDGKIVEMEGSKEKITVEQALLEHQFKKVYLMIGINEMGRGTLDGFMEEYTRVVERIRELQPDAVIILEAIMKVGKDKSEKDPIFNNVNITARNEAISRLADNKRVFYFDMNPTVVDEEGNLNAQYSFDGIHLKGQYVQIWKDFLYTNGVVEAE